MNFPQILDTIMKERNITNYQMSKDTGISDPLIGYWRKGESFPKMNNLIILADYLEVSIDYLTGRTNTPTPNHNTKITVSGNNQRNTNGNNNISISENKELDEMSEELLKRFNKLSFDEKLDIFNYIKSKKET